MRTSSRFPFRRTLSAVLFALVAGFTVRAEIVPDGGTNILSGSDSNLVGNLVVGSNSPFTLLVLTNGTDVTNTGTATVGYNSGSDTNRVVITGSGTRWVTGGAFVLGRSGANNTLEVRNGAVLSNASATLGLLGSGSNNLAFVTGFNSIWTNSGTLTIGLLGDGNRLIVSNLGVVNAQDMTIGGTLGRGNEALITGAGILQVADQLIVGESDNGNRLTVTNSSSVRVGGALVLGANAASLNNRITISSSTLRVTNAAGTATLDLRRGTNEFNSGTLDVDQLVMTNAAGVFEFNGGTLITRGGVISNSSTFTVGSAGSTAAIWDVRDGPSNVVVLSQLVIGGSVANSELRITNGQTLQVLGGIFDNTSAIVGDDATATNTRAVIAGTNSLWTMFYDLHVGRLSSGNQLVVSNGGVVANRHGVLGNFASNNLAVVTGAGSLWTNRGDLVVGYQSSGNQLVVSNGGMVASSSGYLGDASGASNNMVVVTGVGSRWANSLDLRVGNSGSGNQMVVSNGAVVASSSGDVGYNSNANNNVAVVTGAGSLWTNSSDLNIGFYGSENQLVVSNGSVVASFAGLIGDLSTASNNVAVVMGTGSLWTNILYLSVGESGSGNRLVVSNGGVVASDSGDLGYFSNANNNVALVTGAGSLWTNRGNLSVGEGGSGNQLVVSNAGKVIATNVLVGRLDSSINNRVTVDGGTLRVSNIAGTGALDIRRGTNVLNAGLIVADNLLLTNSAGIFTFNGGTFNVRTAAIANGTVFTVGNGASAATYGMSGTTSSGHSFANNLVIASNASLTGNGTITGNVTNFGVISAGSSAGSIRINGSLSLKSSSMMSFEIGGLVATNQYDQVKVTNFVQFAGTLSLALINNFLPAPANSFTLVSFGSASGSFANISGGRVSLTNNLASFAVTQTATNLILGGVTYADTDGDGQGDLQELAAGTNPNDSGNYLRITSITQNVSNHLVVQFQSVAAKTYRIEYSSNLVAWPIATTNVPSAGTNTVWIDNGTLTGGLPTGQRFYRVGLQ